MVKGFYHFYNRKIRLRPQLAFFLALGFLNWHGLIIVYLTLIHAVVAG